MGLGCSNCPLNKIREVRKIFGFVRIKRRRAMLWAQSPGRNENEHGKELIGASGKFLWEELHAVGLERGSFDIQNVVRCWPVDVDKDGRIRDRNTPTKHELFACSEHTAKALELNHGAAVVHLVLGKVPGVQLLGRAYRKDTPILWHEPWNAYVVLADHPAYLLRSGGKKAGWKYNDFQMRMRAVQAILKYPGRWGYVKAQPYRTITDMYEAEEFLTKEVPKAVEDGHVIAVDIEDGKVDGKRVLLQITFAWGEYKDKKDWQSWQGTSVAIVLDHPENKINEEDRRCLHDLLRKFLENAKIPKLMHHGSYDCRALKEFLGATVRGYDRDSQYASYFKWPYRQKHGLEALSYHSFPEFTDYKLMVAPYSGNYADVPLKTLVIYGCADADITARIYAYTKSKRTEALLRVYTHAAFILDDMEKMRGPFLDRKAIEAVDEPLGKKIAALKEKLCQMSGNPEFNPNSSPQVSKLIYDDLGLPELEEGQRGTGAEVLELLFDKTGHPVCKLIDKFRYCSKAKSTYVQGYKRSADLNHGELRTRWHLTGAATGRLRSGGKEDGAEGIVNFQNFHGDPLLQNTLVSDPRWRRIFKLSREEWEDLIFFLAYDYSQAELRMLAEVSQDALLIRQFNSGIDIHCLVGHELTGWAIEKIAHDKEVRKLIKNFHFGIVYGISKAGLYDYLRAKGVKNITKSKTNALHDKYFMRYTGVARFIELCRHQVEAQGFIGNIFGFQRPMGAWDDSRTTYWGNQAINTPIQGSAHCLLLMALALLHLMPKRFSMLQQPVMEVHDALVFFVKMTDLPMAYKQGDDLLTKAVPEYVLKHFDRKMSVPLLAEATAGLRLGTMADYKGAVPIDLRRDWLNKYHVVKAKESDLIAA